ncbi:MAG TPA: hypothetical protein VLB32_02125, partial [Candidatus Acidoferrales bacterium]|nr:hypothetical protein [Candidatus Acidoferrales bacterium]
RLLGEKPNYTGVVSGMSGSPVYIDGKLVGALSLRFGAFTKEPIGGVTPIATMLRAGEFSAPVSGPTADADAAVPRYPLPEDFATVAGLPRGLEPYLVPIDMPLTFVGFHPQAIHRFAEPLEQMGFVAVQGGGTAAPGTGGSLEPGGAVSAALVTGDLTIAGTCTITYRNGDQLYACGHPILGTGQVNIPMARSEIVATVPSELGSFKIANIGEVIGRFEQDRRSAIVGRVGPVPGMVPVELTLVARGRSTQYRYNIFQNPKFSPLLMDITLFNGLSATVESSEEMTYRVTGRLELAGHPEVVLDDMFSPTDSFIPDAFWVVANVGDTFRRIFANSFETPQIERIRLQVELLPKRLSATVENAWASKSEVRPGETLSVKVVLRPYRGERIVQEVPLTIPAQAAKGDLRILVSDATLLNRLTTSLLLGPSQQFPGAFQARLTGLDQLIGLLNRERRNDHLYVSVFQSTPTVLLEDKILPSVPLSQINVLNDDTTVPRQGSPLYFPQSILTEADVPLGQVITGSHWLTVTVR